MLLDSVSHFRSIALSAGRDTILTTPLELNSIGLHTLPQGRVS